jgi:glycosyltransferase involved in cell wall biosynthesis
MNPLISVCIPVYNGEKYLSQCLESALQQTFQDFEILIVDDCSFDSSINIVNSFPDKKIKLHRNANNIGLVNNLNQCIKYAAGEWIKFIFQDDTMDKDCLQKFAKHIEKTNSKIPLLTSKRRYVSDSGFTSERKFYYENKLPRFERMDIKIKNNIISSKAISNATVRFMTLNFIGEPPVFIFRRKIVNEIGYFDERLEQICDVEFAVRIASRYGLVFIPEELTSFRIHEHSTTSRNLSKKFYRLSYIEPVKFAYRLLFDEGYAIFRKNLNLFNYLKLKLYFYTRGYEAYSKSFENKKSGEEFKIASELYPFFSLLKRKSILYQISFWLLSLRRKVFK